MSIKCIQRTRCRSLCAKGKYVNGFFLTADLLGFSNIVTNSNDEELSSRIDRWISLVETAANDCEIEHFQLISDTVFASATSSREGLAAIISFGHALLNKGASCSLPVRGAITHGIFNWGKLTYGEAIIRSHQLESKQNWIGITCGNVLPHIDQLWAYDSIVSYPAPMKAGSIALYPVLAWDVPTFDKLTKSLMSGGLSRDGEELSWEWAQKTGNTIEFGMYLQILRESNGDASKFHGLLPIQVIESKLSAK